MVAKLSKITTVWIALVLVLLCVVFSVINPAAFPTAFNLKTLLVEAAVLLVLSVGMTFVIITAGIDLSVGSVLLFASMCSALAMNSMAGGDSTAAGADVAFVGLLVALVAGAAWGVLNGLLITVAKVPPLIVTLGSFGAALGAAQLAGDGTDVDTVPEGMREWLGFGNTLGIPNMVLVALIVTLLGGWLLTTTRFGRYTFAIGSNPEAARRVGISVTRHLIMVYTLVGLLAGLAGYMSLAQFGATTLSGHTTDNLNAIAGVVLGGTSLFGGVGSIAGTVIGVFIPAVLTRGFIITGVQAYWQPIAVGLVLVAAVWFDQSRRRARNNR
ncbi:ABC transporter permease [Pseudonocardiaceae bacterium YIM PH 21723]|nr:ABC transporter permease [Pseudonocardiaceae bacterium YIM PH 21723]